MTGLDWTVIIAYICAMIGLSIYLGRHQSSQEDYFVGGRNLSWWAVGLSTMATQTSAISFISIPAFVALKQGGGLTWLQYELAVPLSMIAVMICLIPFFRKLKLISVYEYLELRFGPSVRYLVSFIFLISRSLATGVGVYASGIVLSVCLGTPLWITILIIGIVTIIYDTIGGISAVVFSDVIQMVVLLSGILICISYALFIVGGFENIWSSFPVTRRAAIDSSIGIGDGSAVPFWAFLMGGFFLYTFYYGTDQSQVQRELSAATTDDTKRSLVLNGLARFPLTSLYVLMGISVWAVYNHSPDLATKIPYNQPDYLIPQFIIDYLPPGIRGLLFAALLAAAMSSLDSALNSLSASTVRDFIGRYVKKKDNLVKISKLTTVGWGIIVTGFAFMVGQISDTVIEGINKIGSAFSGPILAVFILGVLWKKASTHNVIIGIIAGVSFNLYLWLFHPLIHWMWWNMFGFLVTLATSFIVGTVWPVVDNKNRDAFIFERKNFMKKERNWFAIYGLLVTYFFLILFILIIL